MEAAKLGGAGFLPKQEFEGLFAPVQTQGIAHNYNI